MTSQITGEVSGVFVHNGMEVNAGASLLRLNNAQYTDELAQSRSEYFEALNAAIQELRINHSPHLERLDAYFHGALKQKTIPKLPGLSDLESSDQSALTSQEYMILTRHQVPARDAAVRRAERNLRHCTIRAPFSGIISELSVAAGAIISANTEILSLTALDTVQITIDILENEIRLVGVGTPFRIISSNGQPAFTGKIEGVGPQVDEKTHTGKAYAFFPNSHEIWKAGQYVRVEVQQAVYPNQLVVPREAVLTRNDRDLVFVVHQNVAKWHYVSLGSSNSRLVAVTKGVAAGDTVIVAGHYSLAHDSPVDVQMVSANPAHSIAVSQ